MTEQEIRIQDQTLDAITEIAQITQRLSTLADSLHPASFNTLAPHVTRLAAKSALLLQTATGVISHKVMSAL